MEPKLRAAVATDATSERELVGFVEDTDLAMHHVAPDGTILHANAAELGLLGYDPSEYVGHGLAEFHVDATVVDDMLARLGRGEAVARRAARLRRKDGTILDVLVGCTPWIESGKLAHFRGYTIDVTHHQSVQESLREVARQLRLVTDDAPVLLANCSRDSRFKFVNRPYALRFSREPEEVIGRTVAEILGDAAYAEITPYIERVLRGETVDFEIELPYQDLGAYVMRCAYRPEREADGSIVGWVAAVVDVTARRRAEEALRESEDRYRRLAELLPAAVYTCDRTGTITYYNPEAARLWGRTPKPGDTDERFCGSSSLSLPDGTILPHEECPMAIALRDGREFRNETVFIERPDGTRVPVLVNIDPIHDDSGRVTGAINVFHDMSALRRAEEALREQKDNLQTLLEALPIAVLMARDSAAERITGNRAAAELLRMPAGANLSKSASADQRPMHFRILRGGREIPDPELPMQRAARGEIVPSEHIDIEFEDGRVVHALVSAAPLFAPSGAARGCVASILDITELKHAEHALREADRRKDEFLATLAHELRNPLAPIRYALEILRRGAEGPSLEPLRMMERQLLHLVRLVDDLLDVSRITRGKLDLQLQSVELGTVLHQAVESCRPLADRAQQEIVLDMPAAPIPLRGDAVRLEQVFGNLINNACKFSEPRGRISVSARRDGSSAIVRVADQGLGIPADELPDVFGLFVQGELPRERTRAGLGIGLTLVKRLVEMHGGSVEARSDGQGRGAELVVRLPIDAATDSPETSAVTVAGPPAPGDGHRILVVDDNLDAAESLVLLLQLSGHEAHQAHDGVEALQLADAIVPDVVLLDIGLPRMSGYEVCREIRGRPWGRGVIVVAVTGWGQDEDRRASRDAGFDRHLVKPIAHQDLAQLLAEVPPARSAARRPS